MLALCACVGRGPTNSGLDLPRLAIDGVLPRSSRSMPLESTSLVKTEVESASTSSPLDGRIGKYCLEKVRSDDLKGPGSSRRKDVAGEHRNGNHHHYKPKAKDTPVKRKQKAGSKKKRTQNQKTGHGNGDHAQLVDMAHHSTATAKAEHVESSLALRILNDRILSSSTVMAALSTFQVWGISVIHTSLSPLLLLAYSCVLPSDTKQVMLREQIQPNDQTFFSLYKVCKDKKDGKRAWKLYEIMNNSQVAASQMTFGALLATLAGAGMIKEAQAIKRDMEQKQIGLDGYAYASLINMYRNAKMER